ncbi:DUF1257 domain-containing protein [Virgibacillus salexigens]|uniref:DUF1257 domain-containing protein n=1 Tax=Virgibacillus massiliensis TaxID=1462526 RepID=A0A024QH85_9BACI|nr:DUF1257 domain-containing protein [Virgibacillus massiliensis]CDQ41913.1 hypothetical protein BN990_04292 [Virgibacillus massiliensis]
MSHFATYECKVSNLDFIKAGLQEMGLSFKENTTIKDWYGQARHSKLAVVSEDGRLLPLGWVENQETKTLELQADWFKVPFSEKDFTNRISQHHSKYQVFQACQENRWDYNMSDLTMNENGEFELVATQFN